MVNSIDSILDNSQVVLLLRGRGVWFQRGSLQPDSFLAIKTKKKKTIFWFTTGLPDVVVHIGVSTEKIRTGYRRLIGLNLRCSIDSVGLWKIFDFSNVIGARHLEHSSWKSTWMVSWGSATLNSSSATPSSSMLDTLIRKPIRWSLYKDYCSR